MQWQKFTKKSSAVAYLNAVLEILTIRRCPCVLRVLRGMLRYLNDRETGDVDQSGGGIATDAVVVAAAAVSGLRAERRVVGGATDARRRRRGRGCDGRATGHFRHRRRGRRTRGASIGECDRTRICALN